MGQRTSRPSTQNAASSPKFGRTMSKGAMSSHKRAHRRLFRKLSDACLGEASSNSNRKDYLRRLGIRKTGEAKSPKTCESARPQLSKKMLDSAASEFESNETMLTSKATDSLVDSVSGQSECSTVYSGDEPSETSSTSSFVGQDSSSGSSSSFISSDHILSQSSHASNVRLRFLQKLSKEGIWRPKPQRPPSHQTLIIFDWDDTLLCTSFLKAYEDCELTLDELRQVKECEEQSRKLLEIAISLGQTLIITNALEGWVEQSAAHWAPSLLPLLRKVHVLSARSRYEPAYPQWPRKWKNLMFDDLRQTMDTSVITNIIALGDSEYEMEAAQAMAHEFEVSRIKLVKFASGPYPDELLKQLELVNEEFSRIVGTVQNIRMKLERPDAK